MAEAQTLNKKVTELGKPEVRPPYVCSVKETTVVNNTFQLFADAKTLRDMSFDYFDGRNLLAYANDNLHNFITNINEREGIEDWQARVMTPFTKNKLLVVLSKVSKALPRTEAFPNGDEDNRRATLLTDLKDDADRRDKTDELMFYALLEALVKGTVIGYEGIEEKSKAIREVDEYKDGTDLTIKAGRQTVKRLKGSIVKLEEFYPSSPAIRKIEDMPYCFWRNTMPLSQFRMLFGHFPKAAHVYGYSGKQTNEGNTINDYNNHISGDVKDGFVEVVRYYNQDTDEYVLIANGIWLNPFGSKEEVMPIPFKHKKLPFWSAIYEPLGSDFFWGRSMVDKMKSLQEVIDVLFNMMLDQSFLTIFPPLLVSGTDGIEDDYLRPGRRIEVDDVNNYKELALSTPNSWHQFILGFTKTVMEETSVDAVSGGVAGGGDRVTATEIQRAATGVEAMIGMFGKFIEWGQRDKDMLRIQNVMQFYSKPMVQNVIGNEAAEEYVGMFNTITLNDTELSDGRRGTKIIDIYGSNDELPPAEELVADSMVRQLRTGKNVERVAIAGEYIRNADIDLRIVAKTTPEMNKALKQALTLEKEKVYRELFPQYLDMQESANRIAEVFGDKPEKIFKKDAFTNPNPQMGEEGTEFPPSQGGVSNALMNGAGPTPGQIPLSKLAAGS